jgi:proteic killer suppression protein
LEKLCLTERQQKKELGAVGAKKLRSRLADIEAAATVRDLVAGRPHPLEGDRDGQFAVNLDGGRRLVFEPDHDPIPYEADGSVAWEKVTAVRIVWIGDYHD